jgi:RHH-type proline utilization regulon transcriptional repressor/proline dehydrogenase/delta 1-pyrroline-5-carboxylate dehydrogenase
MVDQVILTGGFETAQLFRSFRNDLRLTAETSGKNAIIVTPSADLDLAAKDVAYSAFGHAGQKCSAASLVILVGSVAKSKRFRRQLLDAVSSMTVDHPTNPAAQIGPVISVPEAKLLGGLTELSGNERWLLQPRQLDESGRLWSPGIKENVAPKSQTHLVEYFGPVLGIMTARSLEEAIELQNAVDYGLTAGIHSLDANEVGTWIDSVQAGNLYVNRGITGAIVQRQPFGGWKNSAIGPTAKAGGPNYLLTLSGFESSAASSEIEITNKKVLQALALAAASELDDEAVSSVLRGAQSDLVNLKEVFKKVSDPSGLSVERNLFRYVSAGTSLRINQGSESKHQWRSVMTLLTLGSGRVSAFEIPKRLLQILKKSGIQVVIESEQSWLESVSPGDRWRVIGPVSFAGKLADCRITVYNQDPVESGRIELLPYFKEQAISITAHRFGNPSRMVAQLTI